MSAVSNSEQGSASSYYLGWDVGGWNCDKNKSSRDGIVILDEGLAIVGESWRGNLRMTINEAATTRDWLTELFVLCEANPPAGSFDITMAIDTPLGFSQELVRLATHLTGVETMGVSSANPYLFRRTERLLFESGLSPLSAVKDMIGSQATKGMHVLGKFAPHVASCGVWTDGRSFRAIETYPTACRDTEAVKGLLNGKPKLWHADVEDARICALMAFLFATNAKCLEHPPADIPTCEGWIWVPKGTP